MSVAQLVVNSDIFELLKRDAAIAEDEKLARNRRASFNRYCGEAMKAHRKSLKLSLRAMASSMGVSAMFLHDMEAGKRAYSGKHILAAAEVTLVPLSECPPGFFEFEGMIGFKSNYSTNGFCDAFCDTGEYFWGGTCDHEARRKLLVWPVSRIAPHRELERLRAENDSLRAIAARIMPCHYCGAQSLGECPRGFPGCALADDINAGEDAAYREIAALRSDKERLDDVIHHADIHSAYPCCGYDKMSREQKLAWDNAISRARARDEGEEVPPDAFDGINGEPTEGLEVMTPIGEWLPPRHRMQSQDERYRPIRAAIDAARKGGA